MTPPGDATEWIATGSVGGSVPGKSGAAAFTHTAPRSMPLPVLIAVPHAGRAYPAKTLAGMRDPALSQLRLEDRHVDKVASKVARETGAGLLVAHAPRAVLDLNRAEDDVDWGMIRNVEREKTGARRAAPAKPPSTGTTPRAKSGLGLIPRRLPGFGEIWRESLTQTELKMRIQDIHRPYHDFLGRELERIRDLWGAVLLIDLHSMPPLRQPADGSPPARIVLGDRFGATCDEGLIEQAFGYLKRNRRVAAYNRPYSGGYVLDRHSAPKRGLHAIQIELCRSTYLDAKLCDTSQSLAPLARVLAGLVRELGAMTARLGDNGQMPQAAE